MKVAESVRGMNDNGKSIIKIQKGAILFTKLCIKCL